MFSAEYCLFVKMEFYHKPKISAWIFIFSKRRSLLKNVFSFNLLQEYDQSPGLYFMQLPAYSKAYLHGWPHTNTLGPFL